MKTCFQKVLKVFWFIYHLFSESLQNGGKFQRKYNLLGINFSCDLNSIFHDQETIEDPNPSPCLENMLAIKYIVPDPSSPRFKDIHASDTSSEELEEKQLIQKEDDTEPGISARRCSSGEDLNFLFKMSNIFKKVIPFSNVFF